MEIKVEKVCGDDLLRNAVSHVFGITSKASLNKWYRSGHTPIRTQMFAIYVTDLQYSVAMQWRTHERHCDVFLVEPGRPDTGTDRVKGQVGNYRDQPRNVFVLCNAQCLIDMAHKRLCKKAENCTVEFFKQLRDKIREVDSELAGQLVPLCVYRGGICGEFKPCKRG